MENVFVVKDKFGKDVRLSRRQWLHISKEHPEVEPYLDDMKRLLKMPTSVVFYEESRVRYFYRYFKNLKRYLLLIVKYLNGNGFIITAYFVRKIK